VAWRW